MKYLSIHTINKALHRIYEGNTNEHRTGTAASGLLHHYFPIQKYIVTPEQIQEGSNRKPDFTVEKYKNGELSPHLFVEIKSLINSNFNNILDQLYHTILETVDSMGLEGDYAVYVIAMKGAKIAFFEFHSYTNLLDQYGIPNYRGFIPLGQNIPAQEYFSINKHNGLIDYLQHISKVDIAHKPEILKALGVESTSNIEHPHIWNSLDKNHENYVHELFKHMANSSGAGKDIS